MEREGCTVASASAGECPKSAQGHVYQRTAVGAYKCAYCGKVTMFHDLKKEWS